MLCTKEEDKPCTLYNYDLSCYRFSKLTERFFKTNPWPDAEVVAPIVQNGEFIIKLFKEN